MKTTDKAVQAFIRQSTKDTSKTYRYLSDGNNLWLRVHSKTGNAAWLYRINMPDPTRKTGYKFTYITVSAYPTMSLLNARLKAAELNAQVKDGINPLDARRLKAKSNVTLSQVWQKWQSVAVVKKNTLEHNVSIYNLYISKVADIPLETLTDTDAMNVVLMPLLDQGKVSQAKSVCQKLRQLSRFAYDSRMVNTDPFTRLNIPSIYKNSGMIDRHLSADELPKFLNALNTLDDIRLRYFILMSLICGTRLNELLTLKWQNYADGIITLTNTKNGKDLCIKLPPQAVRYMNELSAIRLNEYVFPGTKHHISEATIARYLEVVCASAEVQRITPRDLRRTMATHLTEMRFPPDLIEKQVNHTIKGVARHYVHADRIEERAEMLRAWADHLLSLTLTDALNRITALDIKGLSL